MVTTPVVAVASSAGDLEAVAELLSALPADCGAALIIVQQLDLRQEKLLVGTLAARTVLPVRLAQDGLLVERNCIYVIAANTVLTMADDRIRLQAKAPGAQRPGDALFASLAQERRDGAIGVVLSGEGADGAAGVQVIKQAAGATLAQYPGSARFPSMPISAIETGCVGFVLRPFEIARELTRLGHYSNSSDASPELTRPRPVASTYIAISTA